MIIDTPAAITDSSVRQVGGSGVHGPSVGGHVGGLRVGDHVGGHVCLIVVSV